VANPQPIDAVATDPSAVCGVDHTITAFGSKLDANEIVLFPVELMSVRTWRDAFNAT
jgi:hypothetical protein